MMEYRIEGDRAILAVDRWEKLPVESHHCGKVHRPDVDC